MRTPITIPSLASTLPAKVAVSAVVAAVCAFAPGIAPRHPQIAGAVLHVVVDDRASRIADPHSTSSDLAVLERRAYLLGNLLASPPVVDVIAGRLGVAADDIAAVPVLTSAVPAAMRDADLERHATEVVRARAPYRLEVQADPNLPVLSVFTQAPSPAAAERFAAVSVDSLKRYLRSLAVARGDDPGRQVVLRALGRPRGGVINTNIAPQITALTFLLAFGVSLAALCLAPRVRRGWTAAGAGEDDQPPVSPGAGRGRQSPHTASDRGGDWPRTSRVLPWMIAAFIAMLWLVPFNLIELNASLPIDLKLDRLVLPLIFLVWGLSMAAGGAGAPRVRLTWIHAGVAGFVAVACLSAVTDAGFLNQTLEFQLSVKKLTLLLSFAIFFVLVASVARPSEVPAFLKYTLGLALVCALGTIWQYRFHYDVFYDLAGKALPGIFTVGTAAEGVDDLGRSMTQGPAEHPLEAAAMFSMALPIALVGLMQGTDRRTRVLYGLASCLLLAAAMATYRKSALLGPVAIVLSLAYFQRRQLLRLAPLALVSVVLIHVISPGALGSVLFQFQPNRLGVGTVSDRASDYDAIRPDVWSHLPFGLGYGSYDHTLYRVLDSEMLNRLVDTGVVGLLAFVLMLVTIVLAARGPIRSRDPVWAPVGLTVASAAIAYLVLAFLFDVSSFPHTPYILMTLAGLLAVSARAGDERPPVPRQHSLKLQRPTPVRRTDPGHAPRRPRSADVGGHR